MLCGAQAMYYMCTPRLMFATVFHVLHAHHRRRDGGIEAVLDHEQGYMQSRGSADTYSTDEPQSAFHARIAFCLDIHNDAVKAMRFEPDAYRNTLGGDRRDRVPTEQEIVRALEEEDEF